MAAHTVEVVLLELATERGVGVRVGRALPEVARAAVAEDARLPAHVPGRSVRQRGRLAVSQCRLVVIVDAPIVLAHALGDALVTAARLSHERFLVAEGA